MIVFKDQHQVIYAILTAFFYNRDNEDLKKTLIEVRQRLDKGKYVPPSEDGHIICSIITYLYGDYGTSPRYGWFPDKGWNEEFVKIIDEFMEDMNV